MPHAKAGLFLLLVPSLAGFALPAAHRCSSSPAVTRQRHQPMSVMASADDVEAVIDDLVRKEVEACFAGMEDALASGDEQAALSLIETQGKQVLSNVLTQLEDDGKLLSSSLSSKIEAAASEQRVEMLKKYDQECVLRAHTHCNAPSPFFSRLPRSPPARQNI